MVCCCLYIRFSTSPLILDKDTTQVSFIAGIPVLTKVRRISQNAAATDEATIATFKNDYLSKYQVANFFATLFCKIYKVVPRNSIAFKGFILVDQRYSTSTHTSIGFADRSSQGRVNFVGRQDRVVH